MTRIDERTVPRSPLARGAAGDERDALSRARLDLGFNVATVALIAFLLVLFFLDIGDYPLLGLTIAAWVLVAVTLVAALVVRFRLPDELPNARLASLAPPVELPRALARDGRPVR